MSVTAVPLHPIAKGSLSRMWIGVAAVALAAGGLAWAGVQSLPLEGAAFMEKNAGAADVITTQSGLQYRIINEGEGAAGASPGPSDVALVSYKGTLTDGTVFDENEQVPMEVGRVVPGFAEGLQLMKKGSEYTLFIPPELAYGDNAPEGSEIKDGSVLIFNVKMLDFRSQEEIMQMQQQLQQMQQEQGVPK